MLHTRVRAWNLKKNLVRKKYKTFLLVSKIVTLNLNMSEKPTSNSVCKYETVAGAAFFFL